MDSTPVVRGVVDAEANWGFAVKPTDKVGDIIDCEIALIEITGESTCKVLEDRRIRPQNGWAQRVISKWSAMQEEEW